MSPDFHSALGLKPTDWLDGRGPDFGDAELAAALARASYAEVSLENASVSDPGLEVLRQCAGLRYLDLDSTPITDRGCELLASLTSLQELWLEDTAITNEGLARLADLPRLRFVSVTDSDVTKAGVAAFRLRCPEVRVQP